MIVSTLVSGFHLSWQRPQTLQIGLVLRTETIQLSSVNVQIGFITVCTLYNLLLTLVALYHFTGPLSSLIASALGTWDLG